MASAFPNLERYVDEALGSGFGSRWSGRLGELVGFLLMATVMSLPVTLADPRYLIIAIPIWLLAMYGGEIVRRQTGRLTGWEKLSILRKQIPLEDRIEPTVAAALDRCAEAAPSANRASRRWRSRIDPSKIEPNVECAMEVAIQLADIHVQWNRPSWTFGPAHTPSESAAAIRDVAGRLQSAADQLATGPMDARALRTLLT